MDQEARSEVVGAVQHHVLPRDQRAGIPWGQVAFVAGDLCGGIMQAEAGGSGQGLGRADLGSGEKNLPVQVGALDLAAIDEGQPAHAGPGQVKRGRTAEPADADD